MRNILFTIVMLFAYTIYSQTIETKQTILYGKCEKSNLATPPYSGWFVEGFDSYNPNVLITNRLKESDFKEITIEVFFGTWCGDSRREVPRFLKLLQTINFTNEKLILIGVGGRDSLLKQSPQHEETSKGIYRVPTFIVYKNGKEINRINEFSTSSLENDLLLIVSGAPYQPNYPSFSIIHKWQNEGIFNDENISTRSLAGQLEKHIKNENELNNIGHVLLKQQNKRDALKIFQINYYLFPESAVVTASLGEGYYENGELKKATQFLEKSLELNKEPGKIKDILTVLYKVKKES